MNINSVRELVEALKEVQEFSDEVGVVGLTVGSNGIRVLLGSDKVLAAIPGEMQERNICGDYQLELSKQVEGVTFIHLMKEQKKATA